MLANLLPGIRDIRTPLATGYIWLLTFWLWLPAHFRDTRPSEGVPGDIAQLAHYSGRVGIAIALSFIAYLIGALSALFDAPLTAIGSFLSWSGSSPSQRRLLLGYDFSGEEFSYVSVRRTPDRLSKPPLQARSWERGDCGKDCASECPLSPYWGLQPSG